MAPVKITNLETMLPIEGPISDFKPQRGYSALFFKMSVPCYGYSAPTSNLQWKHCIFKGEFSLQNKTWDNFCHNFRQIQSSVILLFGPMNLDMKSAPNSRWIDRNETLCHNSLIMTPVTRLEKSKGLRTLLIFNGCLAKRQWVYTNGFMSLTPMTHIAVQSSEKALTLKSNCFKTHAHYIKRANIYSITAGSFNTRIL